MFDFFINYLQKQSGIYDIIDKIPVGIQSSYTSNETNNNTPYSIYYPADPSISYNVTDEVSWFNESLYIIICGYLYTAFPILKKYSIVKYLFELFIKLITIFLPLNYYKVPYLYKNVPINNAKKYPLIIFSHGLTGTSDEHKLYFVSLVQKGYIIVTLTHCDGSASSVRLIDNTILNYIQPDYSLNSNFRIEQVDKREKELYNLKYYILYNESFSSTFRKCIDLNNIFVGGFSYGAATAALSAVRHPEDYNAVLLLDGWFLIDLVEWANYVKIADPRRINFPPEVHADGINIPACFIGSEQFKNLEYLYDATFNLKKGQDHIDWHMLKDTRHQNFIDVGFWFPSWFGRNIGMIGACDFKKTYKELMDFSSVFFNKHTNKSKVN